jgi:hypothetical protein
MGKKSRKRRSAAVAVDPPSGELKRAPAARRPREPLSRTSPGAIGAYLGILYGLGLLVLGATGGLRADPLPVPLVLALCLAGPLECVLCWLVLQRSRTSWSFAVALSGTTALVCLFGAPKVGDALGLSIGVAVLPSVAALTVAVLLAMAADDMASRASG